MSELHDSPAMQARRDILKRAAWLLGGAISAPRESMTTRRVSPTTRSRPKRLKPLTRATESGASRAATSTRRIVWGSQQPSWIGGLSQGEQRAEVEEWIRLFCERYPQTQLIDVVND